jgi:hypothetical protein
MLRLLWRPVGAVSARVFCGVRRTTVVPLLAIAVLAWALVSVSAAANPRPLLEPSGIGGVHFGIPKAQTVSELSRLLGKPSARFINSGCGPRYTEAAWGHLYAEFRLGRFSGYRYLESGWPASRFGKKPVTSTAPLLATPDGITLESTLGQLRAASGRLALVGTDRWQASDGLIFYDNAERQPPPASSRIVEIKVGTCGDY